ncbi:hypothetical protein J6590_013711 [Homalodisca vitripennis]|nr:hypothetical protein J6590_013711 [Homalodisca vitripennis]
MAPLILKVQTVRCVYIALMRADQPPVYRIGFHQHIGPGATVSASWAGLLFLGCFSTPCSTKVQHRNRTYAFPITGPNSYVDKRPLLHRHSQVTLLRWPSHNPHFTPMRPLL